MANLMRAECEACDYEVSRLPVGDGRHAVGRCDRCAEVVSLNRDPFRPLDPLRCPTCERVLTSAELFFSSQRGPDYLCPRCGGQSLHLISQGHFQVRWELPRPGLKIQVRTLNESQAKLGGGMRDFEGPVPPLHWVEAEVLDDGGLRMVEVIRPWKTPLQRFMTVALEGEEPFLRYDLRSLVAGFSGPEPSRAFSRLTFLTEPSEGRLELDEANRCLRLILSHRPAEILDYFETLAFVLEDELEAEGGPPDWQPAKVQLDARVCTVIGLDGNVLHTITLGSE